MTRFVNFGLNGTRVRFFGKPVLVGFHFEKGKSFSSSACPATCGDPCSACASGCESSVRAAILAWDLDLGAWVSCVMSRDTPSKIMSECRNLGCTEEMMASGRGPDVIVQGWGVSQEIVAVPETVGKQRWQGEPPSLAEQVSALCGKSRFKPKV